MESTSLALYRRLLGYVRPHARVFAFGVLGMVAAAATEPLFLMLEALLRVTDVDAFATLVGLVDALPLTDRERRERLAQLYLRRGFLESAADEWIAVVSDGAPDADALAGLGWVAVGRALPEDALLFAQEALSLDPGHPSALRVLERVAA
jgi:hypothetical protein